LALAIVGKQGLHFGVGERRNSLRGKADGLRYLAKTALRCLTAGKRDDERES